MSEALPPLTVAACGVAVDTVTAVIAGYYTLAAGGVPLAEMPAQMAKRLPRYALVPIVRMGRLAVDQRYRSKKLGAALRCYGGTPYCARHGPRSRHLLWQ